MNIYMQAITDSNRAPRYYHLILQQELLGGWSLLQEWGAQGVRGRSKRDDFATRDKAEQAMMQSRDDQLKRGYRVVFVQGDEASS